MASAIPTPLLTPLLPQPPERPQTGRYRPLVVTLVVFNLVLFLAVLALNYLSSFRLDEEAAAINLAGRERALLQRIPLNLFLLREARQKGGELATLQADLQNTADSIEASLSAFERGGTVRAESRTIQVRRLEPGPTRDLLAQALSLWHPYRDRLLPVTRQRGQISDDQLNAALTAARENNFVLFGLMNDLTARMEESSRAQTTRLRRYQAAAGIGALCSFAALIYVFGTRARQSDHALDKFADRLQSSNDQLQMTATVLATAKQEADLILTTVRQGMLLLDPSFRISRQVSDELRRLFQQDDLAGRDFRELLRPLVNERMHRTVCDYLDLFFNPAKKERQLVKINPLAQIELPLPDSKGEIRDTILEFTFRRILEGERIIRLFVSVRDITPEVRLAQRTRLEEARKEQHLELLLNILHLEPTALEDFLSHAREELGRVDAALRRRHAQGPDGPATVPTESTVREKLRDILAAVHNVKGNAAVLALAPFERAAHEFEDDIRSLLQRPELTSAALTEVEDRLTEFRASLEEGEELAGRLRAFARLESAGDPIADSIASLVQATALKHGRSVRLEALGFRSAEIPAEHRLLVHDILIQLARNAVVHGIEAPQVRTAAGKSPEGLVRLSGRLDDAGGRSVYRLQVEDDGAGIDLRRVKERAIALGLTSTTTVDALSADEVNALIFESGFTTAVTETTHSGHGAGLNFVRRRVINDLGGGIAVASDPGRSLRFNIVLPAARPNAKPLHEAAHRG